MIMKLLRNMKISLNSKVLGEVLKFLFYIKKIKFKIDIMQYYIYVESFKSFHFYQWLKTYEDI